MSRFYIHPRTVAWLQQDDAWDGRRFDLAEAQTVILKDGTAWINGKGGWRAVQAPYPEVE